MGKFIYMNRLHRITRKTIEKYKDIVWVDVWHLASVSAFKRFSINLLASKTRFECYHCQNVIKIGRLGDVQGEDFLLIRCRELVSLGVPIDRFHIYGSSSYDDEWLQKNLMKYE